MRQYAFEALGTHWTIHLPDDFDAEDALASIRERIAIFDRDYSRFRDDSWIMTVANEPSTYRMPEDAEPLFDLYYDLYKKTNGKVTPLIGDVLIRAGYDAHYSFIEQEPRPAFTWDEALIYNYPALTTNVQTVLDVGALGKGYCIDIVSNLLEEFEVEEYIVNAGGDIRVRGVASVALEDPGDSTQALGVARIMNASICGSAGNRRSWGNYTHIINPQTSSSPRDILAVWAVADTTLLADAMTTALFFVPGDTLQAQYAFEYLLVRPDYSIERSRTFPAELFLL